MNIKKNSVLAAMAMAAFISGAAGQYAAPGAAYPPSDIGFMLAATTLAFAWYYFDSEQVGYRRSRWLNIGIIFMGLVAFPYYFLRSRGFGKGILYTTGYLLVATSWVVIQAGGQYAVYYALQR